MTISTQPPPSVVKKNVKVAMNVVVLVVIISDSITMSVYQFINST